MTIVLETRKSIWETDPWVFPWVLHRSHRYQKCSDKKTNFQNFDAYDSISLSIWGGVRWDINKTVSLELVRFPRKWVDLIAWPSSSYSMDVVGSLGQFLLFFYSYFSFSFSSSHSYISKAVNNNTVFLPQNILVLQEAYSCLIAKVLLQWLCVMPA